MSADGKSPETDQLSCNDANCGCGSVNRRAVLKSIWANAVASLVPFLPALAAIALTLPASAEESMDKMWGYRSAKEGVEGTKSAKLFRDGNYGMFNHWGLYSHHGGQWKGKTFYGIGEWIKNQMQISMEPRPAVG